MKRLIYFLMALLGFSLYSCVADDTISVPSNENQNNEEENEGNDNEENKGDNSGGDEGGGNDNSDGGDDDDDDDIYVPPVGYGCPHVNFMFKARVVDIAGNPIPEIEMQGDFGDPFKQYFTDEEGRIETFISFTSHDDQVNKYEISFVDIDGEANGGEFKSVTIDLNNENIYTKIDDGYGDWCKGNYTADLGDVTLERKDPTSPEE